MGLGAPEVQGCQNSKLQTERVTELEEKKRSLQTLLGDRLGELRQVCLLEAELTGKLPRDFPLEQGERAPLVQRRAGLLPTSKAEDDLGQRRQVKTLFSGALRRSIESDKNTLHNKKTVHRGCHTDETIKSESSSMSDSTQSQENEDTSPSVVPEHRSLSHPRLAPSSPDSRLCRKLSPVEMYYDMRTCHNAGSVRSDFSGGVPLKPWGGSPDVPHFVPLAALENSPSERSSCTYSSLARRSNSSEALLDRSNLSELVSPRIGMPSRAGPYKSSESLIDSKLRQLYRGSPERQLFGSKDPGHMHSSAGSRGSGTGYEIMMDYVWGKQQKGQIQPQQHLSEGRIWPDLSALPLSGPSTHCNGFSHSQIHLATAPPPYSPVFLRDQQYEPRRVQVTRTKSCGPFIPLQQHSLDPILVPTYEPSCHTATSIPNLLPQQAELPSAPVSFTRKPAPFSLPTPEDSTRSLHKALALEGLRDWYLRNALGYPPAAKGHDGLPQRPSHQMLHQQQPVPLGSLYSHPKIPQSASFHGHPHRGRSVELSLYPEPFPSQETKQKESSSDLPAPGTLV